MNIAFSGEGASSLSETESRLLGELIEAIRDIRYGSVLLVIHDNRLVEIQKTRKIRMAGPNEPS